MSQGKGKGLKIPRAERCRYCRRRLRPADPGHKRYWPFCSERCKMAELGLWFEERYRLDRPLDEVQHDAGGQAPPRKKGRDGDNS